MSKSRKKTSPAILHPAARRRPKRILVLAVVLVISLLALSPAGLLEVAQAGDNQWTPAGPQGGSCNAIVIDPTNSNIVYNRHHLEYLHADKIGPDNWPRLR